MTLRSAEPTRTCVGCRRSGPASSLVRCAAVEGRVEVGRVLPGRGAWLCPTGSCVAAAVRSGSLARALRLR
ncbi:MAG: YlxR family protein, partial [Microthrixaceae bacterium]